MDSAVKTSTLFKNYKGWGNTHYQRETFEEIVRSFNTIDSNSVLTYGHLIPRKSSDTFYNAVLAASIDDVITYQESAYKTVPLIKKRSVQLKPISPNCTDVFLIAEEDGSQVKNIIPYDYSLDGIYNYELKDATNAVIPFGVGDWDVDVRSSLLVFHAYTPDTIQPGQAPTLTFYQYVGPMGERTYMDAALLDVQVQHAKVAGTITAGVIQSTNAIQEGWFNSYGSAGSDTTQGVGLQYNLLTPIVDTLTKDVIKGTGDSSKSQVVSLLSNKTAEGCVYVAPSVKPGSYTIQTGDDLGYVKVDIEGGFFVVFVEPDGITPPNSTIALTVEESNDISYVLLVKDNDSEAYNLATYEGDITLKLPVFVDLKVLPPHLKLSTLASYHDDITPQYYGPRTVEFVVAAEDTVNNKSADVIVQSLESVATEARHILLRDGTYNQGDTGICTIQDTHLTGESRLNTVIQGTTIQPMGISILENLKITGPVELLDPYGVIEFRNCTLLGPVTVNSSGACTFIDCTVAALKITAGAYVEAFSSTFNRIETRSPDDNPTLLLQGSHVITLDCGDISNESVIDATAIHLVQNIPTTVKLDTAYVTTFADTIDSTIYPHQNTIPFYKDFEHRVFAKIPDPIAYDEQTNTLTIKLDSVTRTITLNERGELQTNLSPSNIAIQPSEYTSQYEQSSGERPDSKNSELANLNDVLVDLYWSKADLKNGKVPIEQLPDSVAYGGLSIVGMWSFEDHNGAYPTFEDVDTSIMSDTEYTSLQRGWFFIVKASHAEGDPCKPQIAVDGEEYTAGDWIIYTGKVKAAWGASPNTFKYKGWYITSKGMVGVNNGPYTILTKEEWDADQYDSEEHGFVIIEDSIVQMVPVDYDAIPDSIVAAFTPGTNVFDIPGLELIEATIIQPGFEKLDRAYLDPVYSRLPEFAKDSTEWSFLDGGTGYLQLKNNTLVEAIRKINEELFNTFYPAAPNLLSTFDLVIDAKASDYIGATQFEYITLEPGDLTEVLLREVHTAWDQDKGVVVCTKGKSDLPLEKYFYMQAESNASAFRLDEGNTTQPLCESLLIETVHPYEDFNLGFKGGTIYKAGHATITLGTDLFTQPENTIRRTIRLVQTMTPDPYVQTDDTIFSKELTVTLQKAYDFADCEIGHCSNVNVTNLNAALANSSVNGVPAITQDVPLSGTFTVKNFARYDQIAPDASITVFASLGDVDVPVEVLSRHLDKKENEYWDCEVTFALTIKPIDLLGVNTLTVSCAASNEGSSVVGEVLELLGLYTMPANVYPTTPAVIYPSKDEINGPQVSTGLVFDNGWGWPITPVSKTFDNVGDRVSTATDTGSLEVDGQDYKVVTIKKSLESIHDLTGLKVFLTWNEVPDTVSITGGLEGVLVQVLVDSEEVEESYFMNANAPVPVFHECGLTAGEPVLYPGKCTTKGLTTMRRISFGRYPIPVQDIYIRVGIPSGSDVRLLDVDVQTDIDC